MCMDLCLCCGRRINGNYVFCISCERNRMKVKGDCLAGGMCEREAEVKVNEVYPLWFAVPDVSLSVVGQPGR
jgi:hypothetical protein